MFNVYVKLVNIQNLLSSYNERETKNGKVNYSIEIVLRTHSSTSANKTRRWKAKPQNFLQGRKSSFWEAGFNFFRPCPRTRSQGVAETTKKKISFRREKKKLWTFAWNWNFWFVHLWVKAKWKVRKLRSQLCSELQTGLVFILCVTDLFHYDQIGRASCRERV